MIQSAQCIAKTLTTCLPSWIMLITPLLGEIWMAIYKTHSKRIVQQEKVKWCSMSSSKLVTSHIRCLPMQAAECVNCWSGASSIVAASTLLIQECCKLFWKLTALANYTCVWWRRDCSFERRCTCLLFCLPLGRWPRGYHYVKFAK
jgi:hypothetical protein